jgi:hypothetical protein
MKQASIADKQKASKDALARSVTQALDTSPDAQQLLADLKEKRGEDHSKKVAELLRKDVLRETLEHLYARKAQVGTFNPEWIAEEAAKAATATLEKAKALMVPDDIGKAPGGLDETVLLSEIAKKDLKPPVFDKEKSRADNAEAAETWTAQRLQKMAAEHAVKAAQGGESKA